MIDIKQFRQHVIIPVLNYLNMYTPAAENLLAGTALQESRLTYLRQFNNGPALGVYQCEKATHDDIWKSYLTFHQATASKVRGLQTGLFDDPFQDLAGNLYYATAMARVHYYRLPFKLPAADDIKGLAHCWKLYYNTPLGKGTEEEFIQHYQ